MEKKEAAIIDACNRGSIGELKELAISDQGFVSDALRRQAWPILLGFDGSSSTSITRQEDWRKKDEDETHVSITDQDGVDESSESWKKLPHHRDEDQVRLDVDRSFVYYPHDQSKAEMDAKKRELSDLITETLRRQPHLCYFQGYHDICQVFLLVLPSHLRAVAVARLSALRIRDFMLPNLAPAVAQLRLIPDILNAVDPALCRHLSRTEPFFALSGTLTMYAHDIQGYGDIARLFDVLLAREPVFSVYVFAQIVRNRRDELFQTPADEPEILHSILSKLPKPLRLQDLITDTALLFQKHPPESLPAWRRISNSSVLKTARDVGVSASQTLADGHKFFDQQVRELQRAEQRKRILCALWAYRQPAKGMALAVLVGVVAIAAMYLRKSPHSGGWNYLTTFSITHW